MGNYHVLYFRSYFGTQSTTLGHLKLGFEHACADYSIESKLYLTFVRALIPELPRISSYVVQHQIFGHFRRYHRITICHDPGHVRSSDFVRIRSYAPAWSNAIEFRLPYVLWIMNYNHRSINVDFDLFGR